jgi:D-alanyl-lipoteichoic acid acyltransferase DltB (MBOAT superfamily)
VLLVFFSLTTIFARIIKSTVDKKQPVYLICSATLIAGLFVLKGTREWAAWIGMLNGILPFKMLQSKGPSVYPVGMTFMTMQMVAYLADTRHRHALPKHSIVDSGLLIAFFPKMLAGPVESTRALLQQFVQLQRPTVQDLYDGALLIMLGLYKKAVVSNRLIEFGENLFFLPPTGIPRNQLILLLLCSIIRFYCDYSGYCNIAVGLAKLLGVNLTLNGQRPFLTRSPSAFWQRWHPSIQKWGRTYLYFPLARALRGALPRSLLRITLVLAVSLILGLSHLMSLNGLVFAMIHSMLLVCERFLRARMSKSDRTPLLFFAEILITTVWLGSLYVSYLILKSIDLGTAWTLLKCHLNPWGPSELEPLWAISIYFGPLLIFEMIQESFTAKDQSSFGRRTQIAITIALWLGVLLMGNSSPHTFLYFYF